MQHRQRKVQHQHNSNLGRVKMAEGCIRAIERSETTTPETKVRARRILELMAGLDEMLHLRVDADGQTVEVKAWTEKENSTWEREA